MNDLQSYFPVYPWYISMLILMVILVLRYFLLSGFFYALCKKLKLTPIDSEGTSFEQIKRDIRWSVLSSMIFALAGTALIIFWQAGWTRIYFDIQKFPIWYLPLSLLAYMFVHDTYFYWTHRLLHSYRFKECHFAHHESKIPTAWTSFAFHPIEAIIQAIILPVLVLMIPIHWSMLIIFLSLMSLFGVLNHLGYELYPKIFEKYFGLISATHHQRHHRKVNQNFGLYFNWWDLLMKTEGRVQ